MNIIEISKKCVGCGACIDACPVNALKLVYNDNGFYEPDIINEACVNCGKCTKCCPAINQESIIRNREFYYGWHNDEKVRKNSSSGGAFSLLAEQILSEGGVVFGAKYAEDFKSVVMASTEECDLDQLRRSKYCQSFSNDMYRKAQDYLNAGKKVMMVGTPCQIAAARKFFKNQENLLLVDFLCGGVTPSTVFAEYTEYLEKKYGSKIKSINMRDKTRGWTKASIRVEFENGKVYSSRYQFDYYYYYYYCTPYIKNEACLTCSFTDHNDADITIADFWGYKKANVKKDDKGISLICTYTEKGQAYLNSVKHKMSIYPLDRAYAEYGYRKKSHSQQRLAGRQAFLTEIKNTSFIEASRNNHFKNGKIGVLMKIIARKVLHK